MLNYIHKILLIMKFGVQFEFHKIPEWYIEYLEYQELKKNLNAFKTKV